MDSKRNFSMFIVSILLAFTLAGCAYNPVAIAETPNQKAGALLGSWNIVLEDAVQILEDQSIPNSVARPVNDARLVGTRIAQTVSDMLVDYELEKAKYDQGQSTAEKVDIAAANLERWYDSLQKVYIQLAEAIAGVGR